MWLYVLTRALPPLGTTWRPQASAAVLVSREAIGEVILGQGSASPRPSLALRLTPRGVTRNMCP